MDEITLIKVYVPESEYLSFEDALELAQRRDQEAAWQLAQSCLEMAE